MIAAVPCSSLQAAFPTSSWHGLANEFSQPYMWELCGFLRKERASGGVCPCEGDVFKAFSLTSFDDVRVVILGQDPYTNPDQAMGLAFSVSPGISHPRTLTNIYTAIKSDLGIPSATNGDLTLWAKQGILLLNSILTVRAGPGQSKSHEGRGWECFTDRAIELLSEYRENLVFLLWGNDAKEKVQLINRSRHCVLMTSHPGQQAAHRGFLSCHHFSQTNDCLAVSRPVER